MTVHQSANAAPAVAAVPLPDSIPLASKRTHGVQRVRPNQVLAIVCLAIALANLDLFIVNVALPDIARDFASASLERLSWILNAYAIVYAALLVFFGRLAERYRRNVSFLVGVAVFTLASAACAAATSLEMLVGFRIAQAAGAALMTPTSLGLLLAAFPPEKRGHAVRTWAAVGGFAAALGPVVGGFLITSSRRWIFLVNVPIGVLALVVGMWKLPDVPGHPVQTPSAWGGILVTLGVGVLTFGIMKTGAWGWASENTVLVLGLALVLLALFVADCWRSANPLVDLSLFRIRPFIGAALTLLPYSIAFGAMLLSVVLWMQEGWGWSALQAGLALALGPLLVPITSLLLSGRLIARMGAAAVVALGILLFTLGMCWWAIVPTLVPSVPVALIGMAFTGTGVGLTFPTLMGAGTAALPPSSFATGSGVLNMIRQTALALGVAIFVAIVGAHESPVERLAAFERAWWVMAALTLSCFVPLILLRSRRP